MTTNPQSGDLPNKGFAIGGESEFWLSAWRLGLLGQLFLSAFGIPERCDAQRPISGYSLNPRFGVV